jgi:type I restriction enzyme, S subunit
MGLKSGYKQTEVGVVPEDWEVVLLDSVAKRGSGHTPDKAHPEYWGGKIKWVSLQDSDRLDRLYISDTAAKITPEGITHSSAKMHPDGTVILSRDAGVGKSAIMKDDMAVSQHFMTWSCRSPLDNHFLYYWLQSNKSEFERIAMGSTIKTIGLSYFRQLVVPLPPKAEQEAIAEALSNTDALIESLEQLFAKKRRIKQGAMQELLTGRRRLPGFETRHAYKQAEVGVIPVDWDVSPLARFLEFRNGVNADKNAYGSGTPFINVLEVITKSHLKASDIPGRVALSRSSRDAYSIRRGDLVFNRTSETQDEIGLASVFLDDEPVVFGGFVIRGRPIYGAALYPEYAGYAFRTSSIRRQMAARGQGAIRANIGQADLRAVLVPLPVLLEQRAIAEVLMDMDAVIAALEAKLAKARQIKQGMMQELLTGRIRLV